MAEFVYDRHGTKVIVLRVPKRLWDQWESRHNHFGRAVHALRESCIDIMAARHSSGPEPLAPDPFWKD